MDKLINDFSFGLFFWQIVLFVALLLLLRKYAWNPILTALNDREEGIKNADYISLHVPKQADGSAVISKKEFAIMKDGVRIANAARGGVINEDDLLDALNSKPTRVDFPAVWDHFASA